MAEIAEGSVDLFLELTGELWMGFLEFDERSQCSAHFLAECLREWELHTDAGFDINILPGDHFFLLTSAQQLVRTVEMRFVSCRTEPSDTFAGWSAEGR